MAISQLKPLLLLLLISLFALPALGVPFQNCASYVKYPVSVKTVKISPDPVTRHNHNASLSITAFTSKKLPNEVTVVVYDLIESLTHRYSLCKVTTCPVAGGRFVLKFSNIFPTPRTIVEPYFVGVQLDNKDVEEPLMCINF